MTLSLLCWCIRVCPRCVQPFPAQTGGKVLSTEQPSNPRMHSITSSHTKGFQCWSIQPLRATIKIYSAAWSTSSPPTDCCSVSSTDHGELRGPICDTDSWLWPLLPRPDHVGSDLRRALEVTTHARTRATNHYAAAGSTLISLFSPFRYIRSERSIILLNFCLSIICSNILILVGQTQTHNVVSVI